MLSTHPVSFPLSPDKHHCVTCLEFPTNEIAQSFVVELLKHHHSYSSTEHFIEVEYDKDDQTKIEINIFYSLEELRARLVQEIETAYNDSKRTEHSPHWWQRLFH